MSDPLYRSPDRRDPSTAFRSELARAGTITGLAGARHLLWPRFAEIYQGLYHLPRKTRRALQRRWRRSLAGIALLYALGHTSGVPAAQIDVGIGGCTLVDAITAANTDLPARNCPAGSGADTITLPAGSTQPLTSPIGFLAGYSGLPVVDSKIIIEGNGSTIARDRAAPEFRILAIRSTGDLTLRDTAVTGGLVSGGTGGGVRNDGILALINSTVSGNSVGDYGSGGGIYNLGTVTLTDSTVSGNVARFQGYGGGIQNPGTVILDGSTISGNSAGFGGAGVRSSGTITLTRTTVYGNSAGFAGGAVQSSGTAIVTNSTVSGNSAGFAGGGVRNSGTMVLTQSTVSANSAVSEGGGLSNYLAGNLTLVQALITGNSAAQGAEIFNYTGIEGPGTVNADARNLFGHDGSSGLAGFSAGATDIVPIVGPSAVLDAVLGDGGGSTKTHALITGSPAIDAVPAASCMTTGDQRGIVRPQDGDGDTLADCDIGAFEVQLPPPAPPPEANPVDENPRVRCGNKRCDILIKCDAVPGSVGSCDVGVEVFVRSADLRGATRDAPEPRRRIRFAAGVANIPPGETANVRLRLTKRGRRIAETSTRRRLRAVMEIRNSVGGVETVRVRIRLRR